MKTAFLLLVTALLLTSFAVPGTATGCKSGAHPYAVGSSFSFDCRATGVVIDTHDNGFGQGGMQICEGGVCNTYCGAATFLGTRQYEMTITMLPAVVTEDLNVCGSTLGTLFVQFV